jgi:hypothetical protein
MIQAVSPGRPNQVRTTPAHLETHEQQWPNHTGISKPYDSSKGLENSPIACEPQLDGTDSAIDTWSDSLTLQGISSSVEPRTQSPLGNDQFSMDGMLMKPWIWTNGTNQEDYGMEYLLDLTFGDFSSSWLPDRSAARW